MIVVFKGGPRDGRVSDRYPRDPRVVACADEARAKGMHGIYRTRPGQLPGEYVAVWKELKK